MALTVSFYENVKYNSMKTWKLTGKNRLIKVVAPLSAITNNLGYVTQEKFIDGLTPLQIERDLGLKPKMLITGAKIYRLMRLPKLEEFENRLSTSFPGGSVFEWQQISEQEFKERDFWPPGKGFPQWQVTTKIPVELISSLLPYEPYSIRKK
ncbi:hypothetical protein [Thalassomonas sp. RHCl1]|uniref:hypothetical protein n=1 Tax=Thalassomonas sp. RHCl1 TaxID=2995320 RepID=UPI00248CC806|nr:hypothetical protein [Thalassomonas sp. RHCl1]